MGGKRKHTNTNEKSSSANNEILPFLPWRLHNVTTTAQLGVTLNLKVVAECTKGKFCRRKFPNVSVVNKEPRGTIAVFSTGAVNITGCATVEDALTIMYLFLKCIIHDKMGLYDARILNFTRSMLVVKFTTGYAINLKKMANSAKWGNVVYYVPQTFGGLTFAMKDPVCSVTVYSTGSVNITGLASAEDAQLAFLKLDLSDYKPNQDDNDDEDGNDDNKFAKSILEEMSR